MTTLLQAINNTAAHGRQICFYYANNNLNIKITEFQKNGERLDDLSCFPLDGHELRENNLAACIVFQNERMNKILNSKK